MALKLVEQSDNPRGRKGLHTKHYLNPIECCPHHVHHSLRNDETAPACPRCGASHDNLPRWKREECVALKVAEWRADTHGRYRLEAS
jgi:uncharacterized paraquat-inducible protein A